MPQSLQEFIGRTRTDAEAVHAELMVHGAPGGQILLDIIQKAWQGAYGPGRLQPIFWRGSQGAFYRLGYVVLLSTDLGAVELDPEAYPGHTRLATWSHSRLGNVVTLEVNPTELNEADVIAALKQPWCPTANRNHEEPIRNDVGARDILATYAVGERFLDYMDDHSGVRYYATLLENGRVEIESKDRARTLSANVVISGRERTVTYVQDEDEANVMQSDMAFDEYVRRDYRLS